MHFHALGPLHHVHNKNSGLPLYVLQAPCMIVSLTHIVLLDVMQAIKS